MGIAQSKIRGMALTVKTQRARVKKRLVSESGIESSVIKKRILNVKRGIVKMEIPAIALKNGVKLVEPLSIEKNLFAIKNIKAV